MGNEYRQLGFQILYEETRTVYVASALIGLTVGILHQKSLADVLFIRSNEFQQVQASVTYLRVFKKYTGILRDVEDFFCLSRRY